ncbi:PIN domain-containing protein [Neomoorella glycerini]|uniref:PIN domain-containing protein n=1 Tax=Neomoorella glycerini TaxID=55779 RepID=UPI0012E2E05E
MSRSPFNRQIAEQAAALRREWTAKGKAIGMADSLIAATAAVHGLKVVTANLKAFPAVAALSPEEAAGIK